nr:immunoglobulin heavy chain junction region [Mus musculus]MBK4195463.1 immunoglobulin heavy chain junction region [Mus musculus]
CMRDFDVW